MCDQLACAFDGSPSTDPDGTITAYAWDFGDGATGAGQSAAHTYASAGTYTVSLTVTDDKGAVRSLTRSISVVQGTGEVSFVGQAATSGNRQTHTLTVPPGVAGGDALLLILTVNATVDIPDPTGVTGWTAVGGNENGGMITKVWKKAAAPDDGGDPLTVTLSAIAKADLTLVAYRGAGGQVVAGHAAAVETVTQAAHTTPAVDVAAPGSWVVSYWAEKSSATTALAPPGGETVRSAQSGTGNGRITTLLTDSGGPVPTGARAGLTATADAASLRATMWSLVIAP
jgi:PKD repeat protein